MTRTLGPSAYRALQGVGQKLFNSGPLPDNNSDWEGWTTRQVIKPLGKAVGNKLFVTIQIFEGTGSTMQAWIGQAASGYVFGGSNDPDFDGNQVQILFDGSTSRLLNAGAGVKETIVSDLITLSFDPSRPLIFAAQFSGSYPSPVASLSGNYITGGNPSNSENWSQAGATAGNTLAPGYTGPSNDTAGISSIETVGPTLVMRDFIWFTVRDRITGNPVNDAYWSDYGTFNASVINPETGGTETRTFIGADGCISYPDIPLVSTLTVQQVQVTLNQVSDRINDLMRTYDCKQGQVIIWRGLFNPDTRQQAGPAYPRFIGFIDEAPIKTPKENESGDVTLNCVSHTQELTRSNADTRSDASQKLRSATDNFYQDVGTVGDQEFFWGRASGSVDSAAAAAVKRRSAG